MDIVSPRIGPAEQCPERDRLLREWTQSSRRLAKLLDEHLAAMKRRAADIAGFNEQIRLARAAETEACRKYLGHVNNHGCGGTEGQGSLPPRAVVRLDLNAVSCQL